MSALRVGQFCESSIGVPAEVGVPFLIGGGVRLLLYVPGEHLLVQECCTFALSAMRRRRVPDMRIDA